jgi:hypothetical protein
VVGDLYQCCRCARQTSVTAGIIARKSHSSLRQWIYLLTQDKPGTHHGLGKKHLQSYCDEFCYRFIAVRSFLCKFFAVDIRFLALISAYDYEKRHNRRHFGTQLFNRLLAACASTLTITYSRLVALKTAEITL